MSSHHEIQRKYDTLQQGYAEKLPGRLNNLKSAWSKLCNVSWNPLMFEKLKLAVHQLAGTGAQFGFPELSRQAQQLDKILLLYVENRVVPDNKERSAISRAIDYMLASIHKQAAPITPRADKQSKNKLLLIIDSDADHTQFLSLTCQLWGYRVIAAQSMETAVPQIQGNPPDIIIMDTALSGNTSAITKAKAANDVYGQLGIKAPIIFTSSRNDLKARLNALRAGGSAYLTKPLELDDLQAQIERLTQTRNATHKILILHDDSETASNYARLLQAQGYATCTLNDPIEILDKIKNEHPDLIYLDISTPQLNSEEVFKLLRQDSEHLHLPVIYLLPALQEPHPEALRAPGCNTFLNKPVTDKVLLQEIQHTLIRSHNYQYTLQGILKNQHQGIHNRQFFLRELENTITIKPGNAVCCVLANIAIKNANYVRHQVGLSRIALLADSVGQYLRNALDPDELVAEITDMNYLLLLHCQHPEDADKRLTALIDAIDRLEPVIQGERIQLKACTGFSQIDHDNDTVDRLLLRVEDLCIEAQHKNLRVVSAQARQSSDQPHIPSNIEHALEQGNIAFVYQPIIDMKHHEKIYEAFARLIDNDKFIMPMQFLPFVESGKLLDKLNRQMVSSTFKDLTALNGIHAEQTSIILKIFLQGGSINNLMIAVSNMLRDAKIRGSNRLIFSFEESDVVQELPKLAAIRTALDSLNCGFLLDRAGTTEHTERLINDLHVNYVKFDNTLLTNACKGKNDARTRVASILDTQVRAIAAQVEDADRFATLWDLGLRYFQGYFIAEPARAMNFDFEGHQIG